MRRILLGVCLLALVLMFSACSKMNPTYKKDQQTGPGDDQGTTYLDQGSTKLDQLVPPPMDQLVPPPMDQLVPPPPDQSVPPPPDTGPGPCPTGLVRCGNVCVDLVDDPKHCGKCNVSCGVGAHCDGALCCPNTYSNCNGTCVNFKSDPKNCGTCGTACKAGETCSSGTCKGSGTSACADSSEEQTFTKGLVGCAGTVEFDKRATLCGTGHRVCKASEWVDRRGGKSPAYNYWTDDNLRYNGYFTGYCYVSETKGGNCGGGATPMRVCVSSNGGQDKLGNKCNWRNCGYKSTKPNQYFGGCQGNKTAGAICCPK